MLGPPQGDHHPRRAMRRALYRSRTIPQRPADQHGSSSNDFYFSLRRPASCRMVKNTPNEAKVFEEAELSRSWTSGSGLDTTRWRGLAAGGPRGPRRLRSARVAPSPLLGRLAALPCPRLGLALSLFGVPRVRYLGSFACRHCQWPHGARCTVEARRIKSI